MKAVKDHMPRCFEPYTVAFLASTEDKVLLARTETFFQGWKSVRLVIEKWEMDNVKVRMMETENAVPGRAQEIIKLYFKYELPRIRKLQNLG